MAEFKENQLSTPREKTEEFRKQILKSLEGLEDAEKITEALDFALSLHSDQRPRPDGPYVNHILRVVNRVHSDFGVNDLDVIIAAALHDSVEDQSSKLSDKFSASSELSKKEKSIEFLKQKYGQRVSDIVKAITNPEEIYEPKAEEAKNKGYALRIEQVIADPAVCYAKLSDFMDNGLKIRDITDTRFRFKLAKRYLLIYRIFINRLREDDIVLPDGKKDQIINELSQAEVVANEIIQDRN